MSPGQRGNRLASLLIRGGVAGLLYVLFLAGAWGPETTLLRNSVCSGLEYIGIEAAPTSYRGAPALVVDGKLDWYASECLYLDLFLILCPFVWVASWTLRRNLVRCAALGLAVLVMNYGRCMAAIALRAAGHGRLVAHDLPDYFLYFGTCVLVMGMHLLSLRHPAHEGNWDRGGGAVCAPRAE